jgi:ElaA protein
MNWTLKFFEALTVVELYELLKLRSAVFVVEQNCVFLDMDDKDQASLHLFAMENAIITAYCRIVPPHVIYLEASIGRVITNPDTRRYGLGKQLMQTAIKETRRLFPNTTIKIGAQLYLKKFYEAFGFQQSGAVYLEDGIEHIHMYLVS